MKNLKKITLFVLFCFALSLTTLSAVQAAEEKTPPKAKVTETTAIVIVGPPELIKVDLSKAIDVFVAENKDLQKSLKEKKMFIGSKPQKKYIEFWQEKNLEPKTVLNKEEMLEFAKYSKYDNVFIFMVEKPAVLLGSNTINLYHENPMVSLEVLAFLINNQSIIGSMKMTLAGG